MRLGATWGRTGETRAPVIHEKANNLWNASLLVQVYELCHVCNTNFAHLVICFVHSKSFFILTIYEFYKWYQHADGHLLMCEIYIREYVATTISRCILGGAPVGRGSTP